MREIKVSVFKDLFKSTDVPFIVPLEKIFERIRIGKSKQLIEEIRQGNKNLKKKLPSILFSGEFSERNSNGLKEHAGLMIVDFDKYPDTETMSEHVKTLKKNKHFVSLFISPGGLGIKGVVRVSNDLTKFSHPKIFKAFHKKFNYDYFDISNSNVDRVCFESYDPNIFINYDAEIFDAEIFDEGYQYVNKAPVLPINNEDAIINKILKWKWEKQFVNGERNSFVFELAGAFCEHGVSKATAEGYIFNNVITGDFTEREALTAIKSAYSKRNFDSKYFEDYNKINRIKSDLNHGKKEVIKKHKIKEEVYESIKESKEIDQFWYFEKKVVKIDSLKYKWFLEGNGFKKYFPNDTQKPLWVKIESNIVKEISVEKIKDFVLEYLLESGETQTWRKCVNYSNIFSEQFLLMLESIDLIMIKDQKYKSFIAFQNGILEVTKDEIILTDYIDVKGYVWDSQIIKRNFEIVEEKDNDYKNFIANISNRESSPMECVIGYLLSTYKNKMNNKAIILNDEVISDNPEGGTGKGLFIQGIKQIRKVSIIDGKRHDDKKSFAYQTVSTDTQVLVFDDVKKNFDFEEKFSLVTEGITLERKNKDAIKLSVEDSPKMVISTNYAIKGEGNSHNRRRHEVEVAQYYGENLTPENEFKSQLFDWNTEHFLRFDNYMVFCLQEYLKKGLIPQNAKNLKKRKFIAETSMEFYEWIKDNDNFPLNIRNEKVACYIKFTDDYQDFKKWLTRKRFNIWTQKYASYIKKDFNQGNSNGVRWFSISTNEIPTTNEIVF